jgi:hydroxyacylglutathione hydrolase
LTVTVHTIRTLWSNAYLIENPHGVYLVDTGAPGSEPTILRALRALGRSDLRLIFLTHAHFDHDGSAATLRRITGAPVAIHRADAPYLARGETPIGSVSHNLTGRLGHMLLPLLPAVGQAPESLQADVLLEDGDRLDAYGLDAVVVHTPGHTPGSSTLLVERRLAFAGDLLSSRSRPQPQRFYATDWSQLPESLRRLQTLHPEWVYPGHGSHTIRGDELLTIW